MILDHLNNADFYARLNSGFAAAFEFLRRKDLADLQDGRYEIDGEHVYALVQHKQGKNRTDARMEVHRKYIDIQFSVAGTDEIGWKSASCCKKRETEFDTVKDREFFTDAPDAYAAVAPENFAIFFPRDAHSPMNGSGELHKVVVKVAVE